MFGIDNILFWSAKPGKIINKYTGKVEPQNPNIINESKITNTQNWNYSILEVILDLLINSKLELKNSKIEILCSEPIIKLLPERFINDYILSVGSLSVNIVPVSIHEPRIDSFINGKFAGTINILDL